MAVIEFPDQVARTLSRADFRDLAVGKSVRIVPDLKCTFELSGLSEILLNPVNSFTPRSLAVVLRHAFELLMLNGMWPGMPALAGLAAARTAALFAHLEPPEVGSLVTGGTSGIPDDALTSDQPMGASSAAALWRYLARHQPGSPDTLAFDTSRLLDRVWPLLGPAGWLMRNSGPLSRGMTSAPVAVCSDRGYRGAEEIRRAVLATSLVNGRAVSDAYATIRGMIRTAWGLPPGTFVALASSEIECELFVLAAAQNQPSPGPLTMVLMADEAPEGLLAIAASGRHVAADSTRRALDLIDGFRDDTEVRTVALRTKDGIARASDDVAGECVRVADAAVAAGRRVVLHRIDTSITGLLAPDIGTLSRLQERHPDRVDVVVDASQGRLLPDRILEYLSLNWIVILTGSGFLAAPASSGAVLFPETLRDRFGGPVPVGLHAYSRRPEWPPGMAAVRDLPSGGDIGLALRWAAALAELRAFSPVPAAEQQQIIGRFVTDIRSAIVDNADLYLVETPAPSRSGSGAVLASDEVGWNGMLWDGTGWDEIGTILSFALQDPLGPGWLSPDAVARICICLQTDLSAHLPAKTALAVFELARRRFQLPPPINLSLAGRDAGILRILVTAPLVSGEQPSTVLASHKRLKQEIVETVMLLQKISLILRHWRLFDEAVQRAPQQ